MRKIISLLLTLLTLLGIAGCSQTASSNSTTPESQDTTQQQTVITPESGEIIPVAPPVVFNENNILEQLEVETLGFKDGNWNYAFLVIKNNSPHNLSISANVNFYDNTGALVGAKSASENAVESGFETIMYFMPDEDYATMDYELEVEEEDYYDCVLSDISYETTPAKNKIILSVTNNGEKPADFVEAKVLFYNGTELVDFSSGYIVDNDNELKPGKTLNEEVDCFKPFDSCRVFFTGRRSS